MYASGISEQRINISKYLRPDILVLDLEDSVPYSKLPSARERVREAIPDVKEATGSHVYCRINDWRTGLTEGDLDKIIVEGLDGVVLAKTERTDDVGLLD